MPTYGFDSPCRCDGRGSEGPDESCPIHGRDASEAVKHMVPIPRKDFNPISGSTSSSSEPVLEIPRSKERNLGSGVSHNEEKPNE